MNDGLISRQAAVDKINKYILSFDAIDVNFLDGLKTAIKLIKEDLPSAQPTQTNTFNTLETLDCISRAAAIDGFYEMASDIDHLCTVGDYISFLESLSAQPEIVRCKHCKHFDGEKTWCYQDRYVPFDHFYCYYGERKEDAEIH